MKTVYSIVLAVGIFFLASCDKLEKFNDLYIRLNLTSKSLTFEFDSTSTIQNFEILHEGNYINFDSILKNNSIDTTKIQSIKIYKINFTIDTVNGVSKETNFDFLKNISVACKVDSPSFSFVDMGKIDSVKYSQSSIDMAVPNIEVKDMVKFEELLYKMTGCNRKLMGKTKVLVTVSYSVDAALSPK